MLQGRVISSIPLMIRARRFLAALLLAAPLGAQDMRVVAPYLTPANVAPAAAAPSPNAFPPLARAPLSFSLAVGDAAPLRPTYWFIAAPAPPPASVAPREGAAANVAFGAMFDGSRHFVTRSGAVYAPSSTIQPAVRGGVVYVRVKDAPAAPVKPVPGTENLAGPALLDRVGRIAATGQTTHDYHEASFYLFSTADNHVLNGVSGVGCAYSGVFIPGTSPDRRDYSEKGDPTHDGYSGYQSMNVEHVFPQSYFDSDLPMRSDLHHLMATFEHPNGMRGRLPFGVARAPFEYHNDAGAKSDGRVFEPPDFTKGRVARAMLYFYARYKNQPFLRVGNVAAFWDRQIPVLLDWNRRFPPTAEELRRNDHVEVFQGNRNPFVDDFGLADRIGAEALRAGSPARRSDATRRGKKRATGDGQRHGRPHIV